MGGQKQCQCCTQGARISRASTALGRALGLAIKGPTWILDVTALVIPGSPPTLAAFPEKTGERPSNIYT